MATPDAQTYARALYETLIGGMLTELKTVAPAVVNLDPLAENIVQQVDAAMPANSSPTVRNFVQVLASEKQLNRLPAIIAAFEHYETGSDKVLDAVITSAVPLNVAQQEGVTAQLRDIYKSEVEVRFAVDESLIGGLIIRVGDQVIDNSLRSRLSTIQRSMYAS